MKMTKKLFMVAIATAAFALTSCGMAGGLGNNTDNFTQDEHTQDKGTKKNLTIGYKNLGNSKLYKRVWKQLGTFETVQSLKTQISIDMSKVTGTASTDGLEADKATRTWMIGDTGKVETKTTRAVVGLIFDLHETKAQEETVTDKGTTKKVTKKYYDFVLIGYRPATKGFYVEKYTNVPEDAFNEATNDTSFSDAEGITVDYIKSTTGVVTSATKFYIEGEADGVDETKIATLTAPLGKGEDETLFKTKADPVEQQQFTVTITQDTPGTYNIKLLGLEFNYKPDEPTDEKYKKAWYKNGYRIGGAGYYVNVPVDTEVAANFNSGDFEKDADGKTVKNTVTKGLEEEVEE